MREITIYTKETCSYCVMAKNLLRQKGVMIFKEKRIDMEPAQKDEMIKKTGKLTVPQIFIGSTYIGGFDDLAALNKAGKLDSLLNE